jgi:hemolysin D
MKRADAAIIPLPRPDGRRDRDAVAFLPAALEIIETPPSPTGRAIGLTIAALACLALAWAAIGRIDIVASAPGRIVVGGRTKVVQPFETGVVRAIRVQDGQAVRAGDVLIELDSTITAADLNHARSDLAAARLNVARLRALLAEGDDPSANFAPPVDAPADQAATARRLLADQIAERQAKLASLDRQREQREAERATNAMTIAKYEAVLPILQQRLDMKKTLNDHGTGSKAEYLQMLQVFVEEERELAVQRSRDRQAEAAVAALVETRAQAAAEFRRAARDELDKAEARVAGLAQDVVKAEQRTRLQVLTAPVDGIVQQLAVHTVGGVVTPAQALLVLVPQDSRLEIEAMVSNRDIGFIQAGQEAAIKVDTFPFTRFGLLGGKVLGVSQDAVTRDPPPARAGDTVASADADSGERNGPGALYAARVSLDRTQMRVEDKTVNLGPGMTVTVEIKTGTRTVLSYLLSPILRYQRDSLRER